MIRLTTPTIPVTINTSQIEANNCDVYATFAQGCRRVTVRPLVTTVDTEHDATHFEFDLTQLETAKFKPGEVKVQVNFIDWMGYRAATKEESIYIGTNLLDKELANVR